MKMTTVTLGGILSNKALTEQSGSNIKGSDINKPNVHDHYQAGARLLVYELVMIHSWLIGKLVLNNINGYFC